MLDFFLDESSLAALLGDVQGNTEKILEILASIEVVSDSQHTNFYRDENIYSLAVGGTTIADLVFQEWGTSRDTLLRLQICMGRLTQVPSPAAGPLFGTELLAKRGAGGIVTAEALSDCVWWNREKMYALLTPLQFPASLRFLFLAEGLGEAEFSSFVASMFPDLHFCVVPDCKKLGLTYVDYIGKLIAHLSWLNDRANAAFSRHPTQDFASDAAQYSVEISPESSLTHKNKKAVRERTVLIGGKEVYCEWHSKFTFDRGRIHFFPFREALDGEIKKVVGKKLIIGVVATHLTT